MYADDILLLSASVVDLQNMLNICNSIGHTLGISFNTCKSNCIYIGPNFHIVPNPVSIGSIQLEWAQCMKYLGVHISCAKSFQVDFAETRRKFFSAVNSILSKCNFTSDIVKLQLLESHCLPILLYACESLNLSKSRLRELNSWWNSVYRKIFNYHKWESVKDLIFMLDRIDRYTTSSTLKALNLY